MSKNTPEKMIRHQLKNGDRLPSDTKPVINGYKYPLSPVEKGYGYYGTIAYDESGNYAQCHICGYFFKGLPWHVRKTHALTPTQYRVEYGLSRTTSLIAPKKQKAWAIPVYERTPEQREQARQQMAKILAERRASGDYGRVGRKSLEKKNKEGRCALQLMDKIVKLSKYLDKDLGEVTRREFGKYYNQGYLGTVYDTFGTWNQAKEAAREYATAEGGA